MVFCGCGGGQGGSVLWMRLDVVVARVVMFCGCGGSVLWMRLDVVVARMMVFCGCGGGQDGHG